MAAHRDLSERGAPLRRRAQTDLARLRRDKAEIETLLRRVIRRAPHLARGFAWLTSMPGVGLILAATLRAELPELGALDRRQIASWSAARRSPRPAGSSAATASSPRAAASSAVCSTWPQ
jgi:transposase